MRYVNCIVEECTHYCGRKSSMYKAKGNPIDLSILGNPTQLFDESKRDENIDDYAKYLLQYCNDNKYIREIIELIPDDAVLGCFCYPKRCHCEVIIQAEGFFNSQKI